MLPLWLFTVGITFYVSFYVIPRASGDIGRLGLIPFGNDYNLFLEQKMIKDIYVNTIDQRESIKDMKTDVLTIGDSFSQQKQEGYQNYLSLYGLSVTNISRSIFSEPIQYAYNLMNNGIIDSTKTKVLIIECVERDFNDRIDQFNANRQDTSKTKSDNKQNNNKLSLSRARDFLYYQIGLEKPIYSAKLEKDFFSSTSPRDLYFYHDDIEQEMHIKKSSESKVKEVYNTLIQKAEEKGMSIILMIAVDKYDLYQSFIVNNPYPHKNVNEDIKRILGSSPSLLLTKNNLLPLLKAGEKDIFKYNDTHWSYKASKVIAKDLYNRIQFLR